MREPDGLTPELRLTTLVLIVGAIAAVLDSTMVTIALHTLVSQLHSTVATIQWVSTGYLLALAITIPVTGWVQARLGGKRAWILALTIFVVGSVLCAVSWNAASLIGFRVLQGFGGGLIFPLMQTLAVQAAGGTANSKLTATISLPIALGPILGPVIGGVLLHWLSWRWLFLVNVPVIALALALAARFLPSDAPAPGAPRPHLDVAGLGLLGTALVGLLLGLSEVAEYGGFAHTAVIVPLVAGIALFGAFLVWATRDRPEPPIVDVRLLRLSSLRSASASLFMAGAVMYAGMFLLPLLYQQLRGESVLDAGLLLIPQGVGSLLARVVAGELVERFGARAVTAGGFLVTAAATVPFALAGAGTSLWWLAVVLVVRGAGLGVVLVPPLTVAYGDVARENIPHATMNTRIAQQIGASFGVAAVTVSMDLGHGVAGAFNVGFWATIGVTVAAAIPSLALPARPRPAAQPRAGAGPAAAARAV